MKSSLNYRGGWVKKGEFKKKMEKFTDGRCGWGKAKCETVHQETFQTPWRKTKTGDKPHYIRIQKVGGGRCGNSRTSPLFRKM